MKAVLKFLPGLFLGIALILPAGARAVSGRAALELDLALGPIVLTDSGYSQSGAAESEHTGSYSITLTGAGTTENTIRVESGTHEITISGVHIEAGTGAGISVAAGAELTLVLSGENSVTGSAGYAGVSVAAAWSDDYSEYLPSASGKLVIRGTGNLTAVGGDAAQDCGAGAGIGGDGYGSANEDGGDFGTVEIEAGTITARGGKADPTVSGAGAGIGGGGICGPDGANASFPWSYAGRISVCGGTVTAAGGDDPFGSCSGAGIGSGASNGSSYTLADDVFISLTGGTVTAAGATGAAGIGGSSNGASGPITIGATAHVTATGGADGVWGGAGIGGGDNGDSGPILIEGSAQISAAGAGAGAGIGGGGGGSATRITIQGSACVTAIGGMRSSSPSSWGGAGIGGGGNHSGYSGGSNCGAITLNSSGTIVAYGGDGAQSIGMGRHSSSLVPSSENLLTIGAQADQIWTFNCDMTQPAFWGQADAGAFDLSDGLGAVWYTHTGPGAFPAGGDAAAMADHEAAYQWSDSGGALSIQAGGETLLRHSYREDHTLSNWAFLGFLPEPPRYSIAVEPGCLDFGLVQTGYTQPNAQKAAVTNTGNQPVTVVLPAGTNYVITAGDGGWSGRSVTLPAGGSAAFTVQPAGDLSAGTYHETLTVGGAQVSADISLRFQVEDAPLHTITAEAEEGGTISPSGAVAVLHGADLTFTVTPHEGWEIADVLVDGRSIGAADAYTFESVTQAHTIQAVFSPIPCMITAGAEGRGGTISPTGEIWVNWGGSQTFIITPDRGWEIADVLVDGRSVGNPAEYTLEAVTGPHTISVQFTKIYIPPDEPDDDGPDTPDEPEPEEADDTEAPAFPGGTNPDDTGVSAWLDTRHHDAYLNGYPGGLFGPDDDMTRAEAAQMFCNLLLERTVPVTVRFSDVRNEAWYAQAVNTLASLGIVQGVGGGEFAPGRSITRAEFTTMAMRFASLNTGGEPPFSDAERGDWFYDTVVSAAQYGWITGYADGTFRPDHTITRAEVTAIVNRMLGRAADEDYVDARAGQLVRFADLESGYWAYYDIMEAVNSHDYGKTDTGEEWTQLR